MVDGDPLMIRVTAIIVFQALVPSAVILAALIVGAYIYEKSVRNDH